MNNSKVFITGITGFVGQNLKPYLAKDFDVQGISRKKNHGGVTYEMFLEENRPYDAMVHLAGKAHDLKKTTNDSEYFEVNYELTKKLYDQFLSSDAQQFIYISSVKAVADSVDGILSEVEVPNPQTVYGKSKLAAEKYILEELKKLRDTSTACLPDRLALSVTSKKKVYILRPCMIHGPGNKGNLNLLYKMVNKGIPYPLGAFQNKRSFVAIDNLNFIIEKLITLQPESGIYNIADDEPVSTITIVKLMAETLQKKSRILKVSTEFINSLAKIGTFLKLPFNEEKLQKLTENYVVSNQKIKTALKINKLPVSATEGLRKTFKSFQTPIL